MRKLLLAGFLLLLSLLTLPAQAQTLICFKSATGSGCTPVDATHPLPVGPSTPLTFTATGTNTYTYTATANSDVIFTHVEYTSGAVVGNRLVVMELLNASNVVVGDWHSTPTQAASLVRHYEFQQGAFRESAFDAAGTVQTPFPIGLTIPTGYKLRIRDTNNISALDTMALGIQLKQ